MKTLINVLSEALLDQQCPQQQRLNVVPVFDFIRALMYRLVHRWLSLSSHCLLLNCGLCLAIVKYIENTIQTYKLN